MAQENQGLVRVLELLAITPWDLFWYFLRIGAILFGSGYLLIAYIQQDLVNTYGWLTAQQLLDLVAIGQFTPGPLLTTAGAIGYVLAGVPGAIAALIGVFLPAFIFVILSAPLIPRMRRSAFLSAFLDGINAAVLAAILITVIDLARAALLPLAGGIESALSVSPIALALAVVAFVAIYRFKVNATWLILVGGGIGLLLGLL
jgi:chromate transporter